VCLLTGASGPLGTAFIERFGAAYEIVAVHGRRPVYAPTQNQEFVDPLAPGTRVAMTARRVHAVRADLATSAGIEAVVTETVEAFGCVDLLVNAAAVRRFAPLRTADADGVFDVNVLAPLRLTLSLASSCWGSDLDENVRRRRNVVNISSTAGLYVYPDSGQGLYATSKAALNHLTYHLASELWDFGIRVNALAPDTFPGRVPTERVVDAIVALDDSDATGQVLPLEAGSHPGRAGVA
jgi:NAD(P)-dependent dehydrogenase (short-subunit alcohol dehydrogenase family)